MNITGIIAEYNPFHLGHKYHLDKSKEITHSDGTIVVMSGNFMQRGIPAVTDKFNRAKIAALNGADLVIELPCIYSVSSAEHFASGGINLLNNLNICSNVFFGMEHNSINDLKSVAKILAFDEDSLKSKIKENLNLGLPFHKARENAMLSIYPDLNVQNILNNSNNILAIEYLKALERSKSSIKPFGLLREGASYNDTNISNNFSSATSIRKCLKENKDIRSLVPEKTYNNLDQNNLTFPDEMFNYLKYKILTEGNNLSKIPDATEGLDKKIIKEIVNSNSLEELILNVKSKRYTYTRISRILTNFFIGLEQFDKYSILKDSLTYIRPLAFNNTGRKILKEIKKNSDVNIITKCPKETENNSLLYDIQSSKAYSMINKSFSPFDDLLISPFYLDN